MRSIRSRLLLMAASTAVLTTVCVIFLILAAPVREVPVSSIVSAVIVAWQQGSTDVDNLPDLFVEGYIVAPDGRVTYTVGEPSCSIGALISSCLSGISALPPTGHTIQSNGTRNEQWIVVRQQLRTGDSAVVRFRSSPTYDFSVLFLTLAIAVVCAIPISLFFSLVTVRPLARRLHSITSISKRLTDGEFGMRTGERKRDEIGQLGRQFDSMADVINKQVVELRQLAEKNSEQLLLIERSARSTERVSLSRNLHDSISQHLFGLAMGTANLSTLIKRDPMHAAEQSARLADMAAHAQDEFRSVLTQLRLSTPIDRSLVETITQLVEQWQEQGTFSIKAQLSLCNERFPLLLEEVLFRVCQECLNNIARHALSDQVTLILTQDDLYVRLLIRDDGHGFDGAHTSSGLGLVGIHERVRSVGGTLEIVSESENGTQIKVCIPFSQST